jgi:hypothetical protein
MENDIWENQYNDELNEIIKGEGTCGKNGGKFNAKKDAERETVLWEKKRTTKNKMAG